MAAFTEHPPGPARTGALIERIAAGKLGAKLRSQVSAWHPGATRDEVDDAFQEACARAQRLCRGQSEGEVYTWFRTTTARELGHRRGRQARRAQLEVVADAVELERSTIEPGPEGRLIEEADEAELERLAQALLGRLTEPQRAVAALYSHGRRRPEIAEQLGMTPRGVKRMLERVMAVGRAEFVRLAWPRLRARRAARRAFRLWAREHA